MRHLWIIARLLFVAAIVASFVASAKGVSPFGLSRGA
jgi:hypothetical protein